MFENKLVVRIKRIVLLLILLFICAPGTGRAAEDQSQTASEVLYSELEANPLKLPETISPRATLESFLQHMNQSHQLLMEAHRENNQTPGLQITDRVRKKEQKAEELFLRGVYCLDLSAVPTAFRKSRGYEGALKLKEILDRIDLPPMAEIPNYEATTAEYEKNVFDDDYRWRIPDSDIIIDRIDEGPRQGQFLFSAQTVARLTEFYEKVKFLPYKTDAETSPHFYKFYISTPGDLLPPKWSQWLPDWSRRALYGQNLWQWAALILTFALSTFIIVLLHRWLKPRSENLTPVKSLRRKILIQTVTILLSVALFRIIDHSINLTGQPLFAIRIILATIWWLTGATIAFTIAKFIAEEIIESPRINPNGIKASYFRAIFSLTGFAIGSTILIYGLSSVGVALTPLLAGVGIGGLAIAMAARPTLENIIGSFTIFADKPYRVGQRITAQGHDGFVESIGLRSTRIRLLTGHLTTIPNEKMMSSDIENIGERPYIRRKLDLALKLGTSPEKMNQAVALVRNILAVPEGPDAEIHPNRAINDPDFPPRVFFSDIKRDAMNILVLYWYSPPNFWEYLEHANWVNIQILEQFNAAGIQLALPAQSLAVTNEEAFQSLEELPLTSASDAVRPNPTSARDIHEQRAGAEQEGQGIDAPIGDSEAHNK
jgi:MscS family membrane protein